MSNVQTQNEHRNNQQHEGRARLTMNRPRHKDGPKKPPRTTGHDAYLKELVTAGASVRIFYPDGTDTKGKIVDFDKYTIMLEVSNGLEPDSKRVIYKHSIESFEAIAG